MRVCVCVCVCVWLCVVMYKKIRHMIVYRDMYNTNFMNRIRSRTGIQSDRSRSSAIVRYIFRSARCKSGPGKFGPPPSSPIKKVGPIRLVSGPPQNFGAVRG